MNNPTQASKTEARGFSLTELLVAMAVTMLVVAGALGAMTNLLRRDVGLTEHMRVVSEGQKMAEFLRSSTRMTALSEMILYPEEGPHFAVSFPIPSQPDPQGNEVLTSEGRLVWGKTVVIHAWPPDSPREMRVTRFSPRDNTLTSEERAQQLARVAQTGGGDGATNGQNSSTMTLARVNASFSVRTEGQTYNFYAAGENLDGGVLLGGVRLVSGDNALRFRVTGRSGSSSGHHLTLDRLFLSPSGLPVEAEALWPPTAQTGATATIGERPNSLWSDDRVLIFPAVGTGAEMELNFYNDTWHETRFVGGGATFHQSLTQVRTETGMAGTWLRPAGRDVAWLASFQTRGDGESVEPNAYAGKAVRVVVRGAPNYDDGHLLAHGDGCTVTFRASTEPAQGMRILHAFISEAANHGSPGPEIQTSTTRRISFGTPGSPSPSAWVPPGGQVTSVPLDFPIDKSKSYVISFLLGTEQHMEDSPGNPLWWQSQDSGFDTTVLPASSSPGEQELQAASWGGRAEATPVRGILGVAEINTTYFNEGVYTSRIVDTTLTTPQLKDLEWEAEVPENTSITFKVRSGTQPDLSDASAWDSVMNIASPGSLNLNANRYLQVQATLARDPVEDNAPRLRNFTLRWPGPDANLDFGGAFLRTPQGGIAEVFVNDEPPASSFRAELSLAGDTLPLDIQTREWKLTVETTPRNR